MKLCFSLNNFGYSLNIQLLIDINFIIDQIIVIFIVSILFV